MKRWVVGYSRDTLQITAAASQSTPQLKGVFKDGHKPANVPSALANVFKVPKYLVTI